MKERAALLLRSETLKEYGGVYQFHGVIRAYFVFVGMEKIIL